MKDSSKKKSRFHKAVSLILKIIACLIIAVIGGFIFMVVQLNKYSDDSRKAESLLLTEFENPVPCEISLTADDKEKDFIYLYRSLKKGCPGAYIEINGKSFLDRKEEYIELVRNTESDFEYYCVLSAILSNIPSCHTQLVTDTDSLKIYMDSLNSSEVILSENMSSYVAYWENVFESNVKELDISEHAEFIYVAGEYIYSPNYSCLSDEYKNSVLISVNDIPIDEYVTLKPYPSVIRYDSYHEKWYHKRADFNTVKGQEAKLKIRKADGTEETVDMFYDTVSSAEFLINYAAEMRSGSDKKDSSSSIEINDGIGYIEFKEFTNEAVLAFKERVSTLPQESPLIIDMRNNNGGLIRSLTDAFYPALYNTSAEHTTTTFMTINGKTAEPVMFWIWVNEDNVSLVHGSKINAPTRKLYYKTTDTIQMNGGEAPERDIYVLIGENSFSAADMFADIAQNKENTVLIGTNTGGEGATSNYYMDMLPNSRMAYMYTPSYSVNSDGKDNSVYGTSPDIYSEISVENYIIQQELIENGEDPYTYENRMKWDNVLIEALEIIKEKENTK